MSDSKIKSMEYPQIHQGVRKWYSRSGKTEYTYWVDDRHNLIVDLPNCFRGSYRGDSRESVEETARNDMKASKCFF